jgi:hypothetical protein
MAINLITGYDIAPTPMAYLGWGHPITYEQMDFQSGNNLELYDNQNIL